MFGRRKKSREPEATPHAPGTQLTYDPNLIIRFKGHHVSLLKLFNNIQKASANREYDQVTESLESFRRVLQQHLMEENLRLYIYLRKCLAQDPDSAELAASMKREMGRIGKNVTEFINHYSEFGVNDDNIEKFRHDLVHIGAILQDRIQREEESLYTLYLPPDEYV